MRSAGCVYNDIVDKKIDLKVQRTKKRLIASEKISIQTAWLSILLLIIPALIILFQFNNFSKNTDQPSNTPQLKVNPRNN